MSTGSERKPPARPSLAPRPVGAPNSGVVPAGRPASLPVRPVITGAPRPSLPPPPGRPAASSTPGVARPATPNPGAAKPTTPRPGAAVPIDPAIESVCRSFEEHLPVLLAEPFERRGQVFSRKAGPAAIAAQYVVRFARKAPDPQRGPAVELVIVGGNRVPHGRIQQIQRLIGARKPAGDDHLRGLRAFFGEADARLLVPFDLNLDEPEITSMNVAAKVSALVELLDPVLPKVIP
jgi:hypothetical protein